METNGRKREMNFRERLEELVVEYQEPMLDFIIESVKIPSYSGEEEDLAILFKEEMEKLGYDEVMMDSWGNLIGIVKGTEPGPVIMFNGHMDVVAPGNQDEWRGGDAFSAIREKALMWDYNMEREEETEVIHGRGTSDMKACCGASIYAGGILARLKAEGYSFKGDFLLAGVVLEETGEALGTIKLLEEKITELGINIDGMICAEPSSLKLALGHRGRMEIKVSFKGRSCHGSSPWLGINAVEKAAKFINRVQAELGKGGKEDKDLGRAGMALTMMSCTPNELCMVPDGCTLVYDRRLVTGESIESALEEMKKIAKELSDEDPDFEADIEINKNIRKSYTGRKEEIESKKDVWKIEKDHPFVEACARALETSGIEPEYIYWPFSTDIPPIGTGRGIPAVGFSAGQEIFIHTTKERVRVDGLKKSLYANVNIFLELGDVLALGLDNEGVNC